MWGFFRSLYFQLVSAMNRGTSFLDGELYPKLDIPTPSRAGHVLPVSFL